MVMSLCEPFNGWLNPQCNKFLYCKLSELKKKKVHTKCLQIERGWGGFPRSADEYWLAVFSVGVLWRAGRTGKAWWSQGVSTTCGESSRLITADFWRKINFWSCINWCVIDLHKVIGDLDCASLYNSFCSVVYRNVLYWFWPPVCADTCITIVNKSLQKKDNIRMGKINIGIPSGKVRKYSWYCLSYKLFANFYFKKNCVQIKEMAMEHTFKVHIEC